MRRALLSLVVLALLAPSVTVLQIDAETHPSSWQTFDYLGEGYQLQHDNTHTLAAYRRSLEFNPTNAHAQQQIDQLQHAH
jgi:cytochrome c-type biogenesis protein CcmH/NrfG